MLTKRFAVVAVLVPLLTIPLLSQTRGGSVTVHYALLTPFIALLAGVLILIVPRVLNYVVAIYLILIGLIGIFGR